MPVTHLMGVKQECHFLASSLPVQIRGEPQAPGSGRMMEDPNIIFMVSTNSHTSVYT